MDQERRRKIEQLFLSALEREPQERLPFLEAACGEDGEMRSEVELLLEKGEEAGSFLETPAAAYTASTPTLTLAVVGRQFGPYRIMAPLGAGGMGEVYRAHDSKLGREVAIKILAAEFARDSERLARFRREARTLALLNHPNIAAIYGFEDSPEGDCLVLELVEGENLRGPLPIPIALDRAAQVAEALEAAHAKGIVHRDLKPANVKVTPEGKVKVLDFGLAKAIWGTDVNPDASDLLLPVGAASVAGKIVGTPGYMSPEQARGREVDNRTDIWAFGCLLYELLTGKRVFQGERVQDTIAAIIEHEPDWRDLPVKTPQKIRELLRRCLQKDPERRINDIAEARRIIEQIHRGWNRWAVVAAAAAMLAVVTAGAAVWMRSPIRPSDQSQWVQLTKFSDSVTQPALSPDGRMLAFIRGESTFFGPGQIYVKILPDGEPVQLTHDNLLKMSPTFSPDGSRIAYTTVDPQWHWDTWVVPVLGGEPQIMMKNASGLVWTGPKQLLFSEMRMGVHMAVVTADENRTKQHDVYVPPEQPDMAHRSYLSPDGKWVLLVEMGHEHRWLPCRVVPADGSSSGRPVGPRGSGCTFGAWTPDGKWVYFNSNAVGGIHLWRQRFPDGQPEQITTGPTEEEGIAMAPDGRSLVTSMALSSTSLWVHDGKGERQVSLEGNATNPRFTPDGNRLLYRIVQQASSGSGWYRDSGEVRVTDLESGRLEAVARGFQAFDYDLSPDGREVVMEIADSAGRPQLWLAPLDHSSPPQQIPNVEGGVAPRFGPDGDILFRSSELSSAPGSIGGVYRIRPDGTGMRKALELPVLLMGDFWQAGRKLVAFAPSPGGGPPAWQFFALDGGSPVMLFGQAYYGGGLAGGAFVSTGVRSVTQGHTHIVPSKAFMQSASAGVRSQEDIARLPGVRRIEAPEAVIGASPGVYAFQHGAVQRNLYRIPIL